MKEQYMMTDQYMKGLIVYAVYRCSTGDQVNSIERQREACQKFAKDNGIVIAKEIVLEAKSATQGEQLVHLNKIIQEKIDGLIQIDGIMFSDTSRIARIMDDLDRFYLDCRDAGLKIVTQKEGLIAGKHAWIKKGIAGEASEAFGENHSLQVNGGVMLSMSKGRIPHTLMSPFGVDRQFVSADGRPICILRRQPGKVTQKLSPYAPHDIIEQFSDRARRRCVMRQGNDRIELIPGDPAAIEIVKFIYRSFFDEADPKGCHWIARQLNDQGKKAPGGKMWHTSSVRAIIMNASFGGVGVACRVTGGVHSVRRVGSPIQNPEPRRPGFIIPKSEDEPRRKRKRVPYLRRPMDEWFFVRLPKLMGVLDDPHLRRRAKAYRRRFRQKSKLANLRERKRGRSNPQYFLSHLITAQPEDMPMIGLPTMRDKNGRAKSYRYYYASRATNRPRSGEGLAARLRADHVEDVFLAALEEVLACPEAACSEIEKFIAEKYESALAARSDLAPLLVEREEKEEHLKMILRLGPKAQKLGAEDIDRLQARLEELDILIKAAQTGLPAKPEDTSAIAASIRKQFAELREIVRQRPLKALRKIAQVFAGRINFDGETRRLDLELRLPSWAMKKQPVLLDFVREQGTPDNTCARFTNHSDGLILGFSTCLASVGIGRRKGCISCERRQAA